MNIEVFADGSLHFNDKIYRCALGEAGVGQKVSEGDNITPLGLHPLRQVLYRADKIAKPKTGLPVRAIEPDDGWCDDPNSPDYNRLIKLPSKFSHEKLWRDDDLYDIVVPIGYNDEPVVPGKGSAIFKHIASEGYAPTEGCVSLSHSDLLEILEKVDSSTQIHIHPHIHPHKR